MGNTMGATPPPVNTGITTELRMLENAVGILQLRLTFNDPWAKEKGDKMAEGYTSRELLLSVAAIAMQLVDRLERGEA